MIVDLIKTYTLEAAHCNPRGTPERARVHGHSYVIELVVSGAVDGTLGWVTDYAEITEQFMPLYSQLDHHFLNEVEGLADATLDKVEAWVFERLAPRLPGLTAVKACIVGDCAYVPREAPPNRVYELGASLLFTFEAAHHLPNLPPAHKCRRTHGHSFRASITAADLSALKPHAAALYEALAYRNLNEIPGLSNPTSEHVSRWIWEYLSGRMTGLDAVTLAETCTARCIYRGK